MWGDSAFAMGADPHLDPKLDQPCSRAITEHDGNLFICYRQALDHNEIYDETSLLVDGMLFVHDTLFEMVKNQCPDRNIDNLKINIKGTVPKQGIENDEYIYVFSVDQNRLQQYIKAQCQ